MCREMINPFIVANPISALSKYGKIANKIKRDRKGGNITSMI